VFKDKKDIRHSIKGVKKAVPKYFMKDRDGFKEKVDK